MKRRRSKCCLVSLLGASLLCVLSPQVAASQGGVQRELWPQLEMYYRFDAQWRVFAFASMSHAREVAYTDYSIAAHLDFSFYPLSPLISVTATDFERFRAFMFRVGYGYSHALGDHSDDYVENRGIAEASIRIPVTEFLLLTDRNRADLRDLKGAFSWRYRNRIRVERQIPTALVTFNPILSAEFFYDSRYDTWNRQLYTVGIEWTLSRFATLETSYQRQNDSRSSVSAVNALAVTLSIYD